ncbi:MAG: hypothetical protein F6K47_43110 [Symploca sp. SIO2E6]|nr:hypothetical protein [Symploca sp. SIO2E6]
MLHQTNISLVGEIRVFYEEPDEIRAWYREVQDVGHSWRGVSNLSREEIGCDHIFHTDHP